MKHVREGIKNVHGEGFTLIELLIAVAMVAILASLAVPSFSSYIARNSIFSLKSDFSSALSTAKSEAQNRNKTVSLCPSNDALNCSGSWSDGWIIFVDDGSDGGTARDGTLNGSEEIVNAFDYKGKNSVSIINVGNSSAVSSLSFNERGRPAQQGIQTSNQVLVTVCDQSKNASRARGILMIGSGRLAHTRDNDGDGYHEIRIADDGTNEENNKLSCK